MFKKEKLNSSEEKMILDISTSILKIRDNDNSLGTPTRRYKLISGRRYHFFYNIIWKKKERK